MRRRICAVVSYFPFPQDGGDPVRVLMVLKALARISELTVAVVARPETGEREQAELRAALPSARIHVFQASPLGREGATGIPVRWSRAALRGVPPWIRTRFSPGLAGFLDELETGGLDLTVLIGEGPGVYLDRRRPGRWHWDKANVLTASARAEQEQAQGGLSGARARLMHNFARRFETSVLRHVTSVSVTSEDEAARLEAELGVKATFVLPSAAPAAQRLASLDLTGDSVLWLSSLSYECNWDGLTRFLNEGMPVLRAAGLRLRVVGSGATTAQTSVLRATDGVDFWGYVEDFAEACDGVRAAVVPIWSGAGVKLKTITLMRHGVPVFATGAAMESLPSELAVAVTEDAAELAARIVTAGAAELRRVSAGALEFIEANLSEQVFTGRATRLFQSLLDGQEVTWNF
jgi:hypothetical protein